jgi:hypothetical protein
MNFSKVKDKFTGIFKGSKAANNSSSNNSSANNSSANNSSTSNSSSIKNYFTKFKQSDILRKVVLIIIAILVTLLILYIIKRIIIYFYDKDIDAPWLIKGTRNGRNTLVINQNTNDENAITLYRSNNQKDGMEFSYTLWLTLNDLQYKYGKPKCIFHKGNKTGYPNRAPGVYLHPTENTLLIYMNTYDNILTQVDITDIPVKKWFHLGIVITQQYMDIYFNGNLKKRHKFKSIPKQNFGNVWINMNGGFDGYISRFRYYRYALTPSKIVDIASKGPAETVCEDTGEKPPYLNNNWWFGINN